MQSAIFSAKQSINEGEVAPFCGVCEKKPDCKEICPEVEALLPKPRSGGHKKEKSHSPTHLAEIMDKVLGQKYTCGGGKRSQPVIYED